MQLFRCILRGFHSLIIFKMKYLIFILIFLPSMVFAFDDTDKALFGTVIAAQVFDGMTTAAALSEHSDNGIYDVWSWKYGTSRPSPARMWGVKTVEIGLAYVVAKQLPSDWRKVFLTTTAMLLIGCGASNGLSFKITY